MPAVVGMAHIKRALLLGAVDTNMGGIIISGRRGTCKTVLARGIQALLPPIEVVEGSLCNADPAHPEEWEEGLAASLKGGSNIIIPTRIRDAPFIQIPLGVTEDRLVGTVDLEASMKEGKTVFQPGLLAEAHRGVLYVDEINLLDPGIANMLLTVVSDGVNLVEREGISISHPCKPLLIATYNPEEGTLREHLLDRFAAPLSADVALPIDMRVEAVEAATKYADNPSDVVLEHEATMEELQKTIVVARALLPYVRISSRQVKYLVEQAVRCGVVGHRAEIYALRVARACAALDGREEVNAADLENAVQLAILPRAMPAEYVVKEQPMPPFPPPPPQQKQPDAEEQKQEESEPEETDEEAEEEEQEQEEEQQLPEIPEFVFDPDVVQLDPSILLFARQLGHRRGRSGRAKADVVYSEDRGRYVKPMFPKGKKVRRLAVDATLRAAAPFQRSRKQRAHEAGKPSKPLILDKSDMRSKRLARKAGRLVIFVVDASGSMALNRMSAAKGAAIRLLAESYTCRDFVSLVCFCGDKAEVLLPPSKSTAMATKRLQTLPCGGGTPLAHALSLAIRSGVRSQKGRDVGRVTVVLITDGRANVSLARSNEDPAAMEEDAPQPTQQELKAEVLDMAKLLRAAGMQLLVVDTESRFISSGFAKEIASAAGGVYHYLPAEKTSERVISSAVSDAMREMGG
jgi:magnesium chelatase subunit D